MTVHLDHIMVPPATGRLRKLLAGLRGVLWAAASLFVSEYINGGLTLD